MEIALIRSHFCPLIEKIKKSKNSALAHIYFNNIISCPNPFLSANFLPYISPSEKKAHPNISLSKRVFER